MKKKAGLFLWLVLMFSYQACEFEKRIPPSGYFPVSAVPTDSLEAGYFWIAQDMIKSGYWKNAPYLEISLQNVSTGNLYPEGYLNATGTFYGTDDFNKGKAPELKLKAGYDDEYIYLLVEWNDTTLNPSYMKRLFEGPADPLKEESSGAWTSQGNQDAFQIHFDVDGQAGKDVWYWSMATTAPFNMAVNLGTDAEGNLIGENPHLIRNGPADSSRSAPGYEWNGIRQEVVLHDGTVKSIDAAYFLLEEYTTEYTGDPVRGRNYFNEVASCSYCHGPDGNGEPEDPSNNEGGLNYPLAKSREDLIEFIDGHPGGATVYFGRIKNSPEKVDDMLAFLRGIGGLPGFIMNTPETSTQIAAECNVGTSIISTLKNSRYQVLLKRPLLNDRQGDVQFNTGDTYTFSIYLSDGDQINYIGATDLVLTFKSNEL